MFPGEFRISFLLSQMLFFGGQNFPARFPGDPITRCHSVCDVQPLWPWTHTLCLINSWPSTADWITAGAGPGFTLTISLCSGHTHAHTHSHTHKDKLCLHCFITHAYPALFLISWYQCFLCHAMLAVIHYLSRPLVCLRYISIPPFPSPPIFWIPFHPPIDRFPLLSCTGKSVKPELLMLHTTVYSHRHMWAHDSDPVRITTRSKAAGTGCSPFKRSRTGRAVHP